MWCLYSSTLLPTLTKPLLYWVTVYPNPHKPKPYKYGNTLNLDYVIRPGEPISNDTTTALTLVLVTSGIFAFQVLVLMESAESLPSEAFVWKMGQPGPDGTWRRIDMDKFFGHVIPGQLSNTHRRGYSNLN